MCTYQIVTINFVIVLIRSYKTHGRNQNHWLTEPVTVATVACIARPTSTTGYIPVMICFWESARSENFLQIKPTNAGGHKSSTWMLVYFINCCQLTLTLVIISASGIGAMCFQSALRDKLRIINYNSSSQAFCSAETTQANSAVRLFSWATYLTFQTILI